MWTKKSISLISLGIFSLLFGLALADYQVELLGAVIIFYVFFRSLRNIPKIHMEKKISKTKSFEGEYIEFENNLICNNNSPLLAQIYDKVSDRMLITSGTNRLTLPIEKSKKWRMKYTTLTPLRGYHLVGPIKVRAWDYSFLFYNEFEIGNENEIAVYPFLGDVKMAEVWGQVDRYYPGEHLTKKPGTSTEFLSIRDYVKGDPWKWINWKASCKEKKLMVNQYEKENICDLYIVIDARQSNLLGTVASNALEYSIKAAAEIALFFIKKRNQVGLIIYNDMVSVIKPGSGMKHFTELLTALTNAYGRGNMTAGAALEMIMPYMNPKTTIIFFSGLEYDPTISTTITKLKLRGHRLIIVSPSPIDFEVSAAGYYSYRHMLVRLERTNFINELRTVGAEVIDWKPEESVEVILKRCRGVGKGR